MTKKHATYTNPNTGIAYPLFEAVYDYNVEVYASDLKKAVTGDPYKCVIALGLMRDKHVLEACIGSGKDGYVIFKADGMHPVDYAMHFTLPANTRRTLDEFDKNKKAKTTIIKLRAPTPGRTLAARSVLGKKRRAAIKAGAPVKKRANVNRPRITRLGVPHRPTPIIKNGAVSFPQLTP